MWDLSEVEVAVVVPDTEADLGELVVRRWCGIVLVLS